MTAPGGCQDQRDERAILHVSTSPPLLKLPVHSFNLCPQLYFFNIGKCFRTAGTYLARVDLTCHRLLSLWLSSTTLKPCLSMKVSIIVMYPKGEKVGRQRRCSPLGHVIYIPAWPLTSPCPEVLGLITTLLLQEEQSSGVYTYIRAVCCKPLVLHHWGSAGCSPSQKLLQGLMAWTPGGPGRAGERRQQGPPSPAATVALVIEDGAVNLIRKDEGTVADHAG